MCHVSTTQPRMDATLYLSTRTLAWLTRRPGALMVVNSVSDTLAELDTIGHHPRLLAALRFVDSSPYVMKLSHAG